MQAVVIELYMASDCERSLCLAGTVV